MKIKRRTRFDFGAAPAQMRGFARTFFAVEGRGRGHGGNAGDLRCVVRRWRADGKRRCRRPPFRSARNQETDGVALCRESDDGSRWMVSRDDMSGRRCTVQQSLAERVAGATWRRDALAKGCSHLTDPSTHLRQAFDRPKTNRPHRAAGTFETRCREDQ